MIDLLQIDDFLDAAACASLRAELQQAAGDPATLLGRTGADAVQPLVRRTTRAAMPPAIRDRMTGQLLARKDALERHFGVTLDTCEEPQFLRYGPGDFFVAHQDGNTPLLYDASRFRRISAIIFLSASSPEPLPDTYGGGVLTFHDPVLGSPRRLPLTPSPGTFLAFRAETTHEVTPVTHGERFTIVSWYR
jgi:predicted 2-oxoglutarate/Fe(II)-dependent dioxygenase YbiX